MRDPSAPVSAVRIAVRRDPLVIVASAIGPAGPWAPWGPGAPCGPAGPRAPWTACVAARSTSTCHAGDGGALFVLPATATKAEPSLWTASFAAYVADALHAPRQTSWTPRSARLADA